MEPFSSLEQNDEYSLMGRTYSLGYKPHLSYTLLYRPRRTVLNKDWSWVVWYQLRQSGRVATLIQQDQRVILSEHGAIRMYVGAPDYAH